MKQSDLYRQNAENCMQMAEAAHAGGAGARPDHPINGHRALWCPKLNQ
jgi:hypothetical protein